MKKSLKTLSIELFPPKMSEALVQLRHTCIELAQYQPCFFSVTFGAAGSSQDKTLALVNLLCEQNFKVAPHLTSIGLKRNDVKTLLDIYYQKGIHHLVVIRGDLPENHHQSEGDFKYADELVNFIREQFNDHFYIHIAAYPEFHPHAKNAYEDFLHFENKVKQGANAAITQFFFNVDAYYFFLENCAQKGITIPIIPGIMPISNFKRLSHFANLCGAEIPLWIKKRIESYGDDEISIQKFGVEVITKLCQDLLRLDVPGFHFYSLNNIEPTKQILDNLQEFTESSTETFKNKKHINEGEVAWQSH